MKTSALELQEVAAKAALAAGNIAPDKIDHVIIGHVMAVSTFLLLLNFIL